LKIKVLYFALFREETGISEEIIELPEGAKLQLLEDHLTHLHPSLANLQASAIYSVNRKYVKPDLILKECDEVALFPPISGG
jgi:molybdopterin synthase sulfur carrier subunit